MGRTVLEADGASVDKCVWEMFALNVVPHIGSGSVAEISAKTAG